MSEEWDRESFFRLHADLPREGPGETADVAWAAEVANVPASARILDAASGPGGDIGALLRAAPDGHITAIDLHAPFIEAARTRWQHDPRVSLRVGDMSVPKGPFDLIWCAGAVYFLGIEAALTAWRDALSPGGVVAFSEPCFFTDAPTDAARAFWDGEGLEIGTAERIAQRVDAAGFETLATRALSDVAWESYFRPLEDRIARLRPAADARLVAVIDKAASEYKEWQACKRETGYLLSVVRPK